MRPPHYRVCPCGRLLVGLLLAPMVNETLWRKISRGKIETILCLPCFRRRLGRPVTPMDQRDPWWPYQRGWGAVFTKRAVAARRRWNLWPGIEWATRLRELARDGAKFAYIERQKIRRFNPRTGLVFTDGKPFAGGK